MQVLLISTHAPLISHAHQALADDCTLVVASTTAGVLQAFKINRPAIVILDISSIKLDDFAQKFSEHYRRQIRPAIVIISQNELPTADLLSLGIQGFGRYDGDGKDGTNPPLPAILAHAQKPTLAQHHATPAIVVHSHRGDERIFIHDIFYCQAEHKYTKIHHRHGTTLTDDTLKSLQNAHPADFVRIHRHTLAAVRHLHKISDDGNARLYLHGVALPLAISRRCLPQIRQIFVQLGEH